MRVLFLVPLFTWCLHRVKSMLHTNEICQYVKNMFHTDDIYQMNIFITRTLQRLVSTNEKQFTALEERINLLSSSMERVTEEVSTTFTRMDQKLETLIVKSEEVSIRPDTNWKEVDDMIYLLKKEGGKMSVVLHRCHQLSQTIGDNLVDNHRLLLKSFDISK